MSDSIVRAETGSTALIVPQVNASYFGAILEGTDKTIERLYEANERVEEALKQAAKLTEDKGGQFYYLGPDLISSRDGRERLRAQVLEARGAEYGKVKRICDMVAFRRNRNAKETYWPEDCIQNYSASLEGLENIVSGIGNIRRRNWEFVSSYLVVVPRRDKGERHVRANIPVTEKSSAHFLFAGFSSEHVVPFDFQYYERWEENRDRFAAALAGLDGQQTGALVGIVLRAYNDFNTALVSVAEPFSELLGYEPRATEEIEAQISILNSCMAGLKDGAPLEKVRYSFRIEQALGILGALFRKTIVEPVNYKLRIYPVRDAKYGPSFNNLLHYAGFSIHYRRRFWGFGSEDPDLGEAYAIKQLG